MLRKHYMFFLINTHIVSFHFKPQILNLLFFIYLLILHNSNGGNNGLRRLVTGTGLRRLVTSKAVADVKAVPNTVWQEEVKVESD